MVLFYFWNFHLEEPPHTPHGYFYWTFGMSSKEKVMSWIESPEDNQGLHTVEWEEEREEEWLTLFHPDECVC